ncbi:MAG: hypothetical protein M3N47_05785, partial [Chloroflexota bacterium]|nr:hypothetical protein [Chloroflexota bacterium]
HKSGGDRGRRTVNARRQAKRLTNESVIEPSRQPAGRKLVDLAGAVIIMFVVFASGVLIVLRANDDEDSTGAATTAAQQYDASARTTATREASLTVGEPSLLPVPDDLSVYIGQQAEGKRVEVQSVVEGGFWVGRSQTDRVYVKCRREIGDNESTFDPTVAAKVNLTGRVRPAPDDPRTALRLNPPDSDLVRRQGAYIDADTVQQTRD